MWNEMTKLRLFLLFMRAATLLSYLLISYCEYRITFTQNPIQSNP